MNEQTTLRDYFAAHALASGNFPVHVGDYHGLAKAAYEVADAMIAERGKPSQAAQQGDSSVLADLRDYFPDAATLHDCYRGIEALQDKEKDAYHKAQETGLEREIMLVALQGILDAWEKGTGMAQCIQKARGVVIKAKGREA